MSEVKIPYNEYNAFNMTQTTIAIAQALYERAVNYRPDQMDSMLSKNVRNRSYAELKQLYETAKTAYDITCCDIEEAEKLNND